MFDEMDRLRESKELLHLLTHYADLGKADRQLWQDRLMESEGMPGRDLVKRHGELLAYGWIEQNTANTSTGRQGAASCCYRITSAGVRALKQAHS
jgi:hypothetical protein